MFYVLQILFRESILSYDPDLRMWQTLENVLSPSDLVWMATTVPQTFLNCEF